MPIRAEAGASVVEVRARRSAGPAESGALGVGLGAAGEFIRRQQALAAERKAAREAEAAAEEAPELPGTGLVMRRG